MDLRIRIATFAPAACLFLLAGVVPAVAAHAGELRKLLSVDDSEAGNGAIVDRRACNLPFDTYAAWLTFTRERYLSRGAAFDEGEFRVNNSEANFAGVRDGTIECWAITYRSDGLDVDGFILHSRQRNSGALPAIVFNRGGNRDFGRLVFADLIELARCSTAAIAWPL